ncbi:MAG: hypothetical protein A3G38_04125 [Omnitrophica WOR_2 bacterium RIFCSPLOWO2_12_FULL_51_8]|nr:MAG: hypothetical protein A3G38_04125 [Omnitrophica WOR_2 bacterium RIFCSPLOWO2_12_FULL_51_8]
MKRLLVLLAVLSLVLPLAAAAQESPAAMPEKTKEFAVYLDKTSRENHFIPSGWMGDHGDIKINDQSMDNPHGGTTCIQFTYSAKKSQGQGWAGVYWQNPVNNWGNKKGGYDLSSMNKLTFWARGAKGGEVIQKFVVGGIKGTYPDTASAETGPIELTNTWKPYSVNLSGKDLTYINGGFGWVTTADLNPEGCAFFLDDIKFENESGLKPEGKKQEEMPFYVYADRSSPKNHFIPSGWMGDYGDLKYDGVSREDPYLGDTCIKIIYSPKKSQGQGWAGIYWQNPANNWGDTDAGFDLSKTVKLSFWARGANGGERIEEFKAGGLMGEYSDSDSSSIAPVILNKEWTQYAIDLKGKDMSYVIGGFAWSTNLDNNPDGLTFYLDEIKYE